MAKKGNTRDWKKGLSNALISLLFDRPMRILAEKFTRGVPENSPLRSATAESIFAAFKGAMEGFKGNVLVEKATDFGDFISAQLFREEESNATQILAMANAWLTRFVKSAEAQLKSCKTVDEVTTMKAKLDEVSIP